MSAHWPDVPAMLYDRIAAALVRFLAVDNPRDDPGDLIDALRAEGLEVRPIDPILEAQETTGNWEVDP